MPSSKRNTGTTDQPVEDNRPCIFKYITAIARIWSLLTLAGLWALTIQALREKEKKDVYTHWYLLAISPVVTFFEVLWLFNKCACCKYDEGCCCRFWHVLLWVDGWKKTIVYILFAVPCFVKGIVALWAVLYGVLLVLLALLYLLKSIKYCSCVEKKRTRVIRQTDDPRASLVSNDIPPASSNGAYQSTRTVRSVTVQSVSTRQPPSRSSQWPPEGYVQRPDGVLIPVETEPEQIKPNQADKNFKQRESSSNEAGQSQWPPPGYALGKDGRLEAMANPEETQQPGNSSRQNPFDKASEEP